MIKTFLRVLVACAILAVGAVLAFPITVGGFLDGAGPIGAGVVFFAVVIAVTAFFGKRRSRRIDPRRYLRDEF
jgi:membrane protease YdiL (CAAX protease family)